MQRIELPPPGRWLFGLAAVYLLLGLIGHDPWKTDDAVGFGVVHDMTSSGRWLAPHLAAEPFLEDGPLFYWVAAFAATLLSFTLPPHDGARFASLLFIAAALFFTRLAARELYGKREGDLSMLALMGSIGFMVHARETTADTAMLGAVAAAYYGVAIAWKKPLKAGLMFGAGAACAFLARGLVASIPPLIAGLALLPIAIYEREKSFVRAMAIGVPLFLLLAALWPLAIARYLPDYSALWWAFQIDNVTRAPRLDVLVSYLKMLAWLAWPVWPLALWALWAYRRRIRNPGFGVPFVASLVTLVLLLCTRTARETDSLALLVPLAIPAGAMALNLRRGAASALTWFALMTFTLLVAALWVMWFAMMTGWPAQLALNVAKLEPGFVPRFSAAAFIAALALSAAWIYFIRHAEVSTRRSIPIWTVGLTVIWGLTMTLWIAWIDYGKSYRNVGAGVAGVLNPGSCVASLGLGEVQRAVFHYHAGITTERIELGRGAACGYLLVQASSREAEADPGPAWRKIWEGARPRDRERYRLYERLPN